MRISLLTLFFLLAGLLGLYAQASISGVVNDYSAVTNLDTCSNSITVSNPGFFGVGDTVLLIQMKGATIDVTNTASYGSVTTYNSAGLYEFNVVQAVNGSRIILQFEFSNSYDPTGALQLVTVPQYNGAVLTANVTCQAWNGTTGGVISFMVNGTLDLNGNNITANFQGFRGATYVDVASACNFVTTANAYFYPLGDWQGAPRGEGIAYLTPNREWGRGAQANGGGGGNDHNAGGGGGSNASAGGQGGENQDPGQFNCKGFFPGIGGNALTGGSGRLFMGGGGGAGHGNNTSNSDGGNGGGIIIIRANSIEGNNGAIAARGQNGFPSSNDGAGGGGAGGTILLEANSLGATPITINNRGGDGANANNIFNRCYGPGGGGSGGEVFLSLGAGPANLSVNVSGGANGITTASTAPCNGSALNATPGQAGGTTFNSNLVFSQSIPSSSITISCPANINQPTDSGFCWGTVLYPNPTASGGCGPINIQRIQGAPTGSTFPVGTSIIRYVASDTSGLTDTCQFTITVTDTQSPAIVPPTPITTCNSVVSVPLLVTSDNCGIDSIWNSFNGSNNASGTYPQGATTVNWFVRDSSGNTSSVSQSITVTTIVIRDTIPVNLCSGDSFNGTPYFSDTILVDSFVSIAGCDSLWYTNITVGSSITTNLSPTICQGDTFRVGSSIYTTTGNYSDTFALGGCDSIVQTSLTVTNAISSNLNTTICNGDSIFLEGAWQTTSGTYTDTFNSSAGCDSIVQVNLSVQSIPLSLVTEFICQGDSFLINGVWRFTPGFYFDTLPSVNSCDSVIRYTLIVTPPVPTMIDTGVCQRDSIFLAGAWRFWPGQYRDTFTAVGTACDSIVQYNLVLWPRLATSGNYDTICEGDSFLIGNIWYDSTGIFFDTTTSIQWGCDSIVSNFLFVRPAIPVQNLNQGICTGDTFRVGSSAYTTPGIYTDTLISEGGCDSVVVTNLTVGNSIQTSRNLAICQGDSIFLEGAWQSSAGIYFDTFSTSSGCDSIVETNLTVLQNSLTQLSPIICQGDSFFAGGSWQTASGIYSDNLVNSNGCDSVVEVNLTVLPNSVVNLAASICLGDSFFASGAWQTSSGVYGDTFLAANGCDSIVATALSVTAPPISNRSIQLCTGDSAFLAGNWQTTPGIYLDTIKNPSGCDSVLRTTLTFINQLTTSGNQTICEGDSIFAGGAFQTQSGTYRDTFVSTGGCDSIHITILTVQPANVSTVNEGICVGDSVFLGGAWRFLSGTYFDTLTNPGGCLQVVRTRLFVSPPVVITEPVQTITIPAGQSIRLRATGANNYVWTPDSSLDCTTCESPLASPTTTTTYTVYSADSFGCPSSDTITIIVDTVGSVEIPNVFTPNGDGVNDFWYINVQGVNGVQINVYDRWGQKVFDATDPNDRWDGTCNGKLLDAAVFTYHIILIYENFREDLTGDITLIR
jgi:gliding motility-associated-like protein